MKIGINHASENFDHTVLAEVISSRWREDRPFFTLNREARGARLDASWLQQPANSALELHWSRRWRRRTGHTALDLQRSRRAPRTPAMASNLSVAE